MEIIRNQSSLFYRNLFRLWIDGMSCCWSYGVLSASSPSFSVFGSVMFWSEVGKYGWCTGFLISPEKNGRHFSQIFFYRRIRQSILLASNGKSLTVVILKLEKKTTYRVPNDPIPHQTDARLCPAAQLLSHINDINEVQFFTVTDPSHLVTQ